MLRHIREAWMFWVCSRACGLTASHHSEADRDERGRRKDIKVGARLGIARRRRRPSRSGARRAKCRHRSDLGIAACTGRCSSFPTTTTTDSVPSNMPQASSSKKAASVDDGEIDRLLSRQANALQREVEVERILKAFKLKCVHAAHSGLTLRGLICVISTVPTIL